MRTSHVKATDTQERWFLFDASEHVLGRMAADIATRLQGKDRPTYTPSEPGNTHVVVVNAARARFTGTKDLVKEYQTYSGYPGGRYVRPLSAMRERRPRDIVSLAVRRMLPKNRRGHTLLGNLKVYGDGDHPHAAQKPVKVESTLS
jgi:large subunit ribosomal protein L13